MPMLNMRLVRPSVIVDINGIPGLDYVRESSSSDPQELAIGGLSRHRALERSTLLEQTTPVLAHAMPHVGHLQIRNRGTIGGSMVHCDPAAELPALALALDAQFLLRSSAGERTVAASDFFIASLTTIIEPGELLTEVRLPAWDTAWGWGFQEVCRRDSDFALAGAIALVRLGDAQIYREARIVVFGVGGVPQRISGAEEALTGRFLDEPALREAAGIVQHSLHPNTDIHASSEYRKEVGAVVARRSLEEARDRAVEVGK